jgi:hypothetical protein
MDARVEPAHDTGMWSWPGYPALPTAFPRAGQMTIARMRDPRLPTSLYRIGSTGLPTSFVIPRRNASEPLMKCFAPFEGVGNAGCPLHPRSRVHVVVVEGTRVTTSTPESPGIPARNGFTAYFALSPVTGLVCHRRSTDMVLSKPGWADLNSANLTPASGCQDHTTSPYATTSLVRVPLIAHRLITRPAIPSHARRCRVHRIPPRVS